MRITFSLDVDSFSHDIKERTQSEGRSIERIVREEIAELLGISDEFGIGIGPVARPPVRDDQNSTLPLLCGSERLATLSSTLLAGRNAASREEIEKLIEGVEKEAQGEY